MKNIPTQPIEAAYCKPAKALKASSRPKTTTKKGRGKRVDPAVAIETEACTEAGAFQVYLKQIGTKPLLSREQEAALGNRIRAGFDALLQHLLPCGRIGDMLLEQAQAELTRANCQPARRSALGAALIHARAFLHNARERFAAGSLQSADLRTEMAAAFGDLVAVLEIWPNRSLDLLAQVEREFSAIYPEGSTFPQTGGQEEFTHRYLMDTATCRNFLAGARRLRAAAVASRNEMVDANLRLVVSTAKIMKRSLLSFEDLVQEGNRGLLTAAERFDERLGYRFSTFATRLIKSAMRRENDNQGRTIRLPVHRCEALRKFEAAHRSIEDGFHRPASVQELAEATGFACAEVRELFVLKQGIVSIDQSLGDEGGLTLEAVLPDPDSLPIGYAADDLAGCLDSYAGRLDEPQRNVVACLYGIWGRPRLSLEETADELGLSRAEVMRLDRDALELLRGALSSAGDLVRYARAA